MFRTLPVLLILAGGALGAAVFLGGGPRAFFTGDPPRADNWLRRELSNAEDAAEQMFRNGRRGRILAAAKALEQAILASRASALSTGIEPIPRAIREQLED